MRISVIIIWSIILLSVVGLARGPEGSDKASITREEIWRRKLTAPPVFDVVFAGDSRTLYDISPSALADTFPTAKSFNFAFNYVGITAEYLQETEEKLNPFSTRKIIVLGITPRELTPLNLRVNGFAEERDRARSQKLFDLWFPGASTFFRPIIVGSTVQRVLGTLRWDQNFYPDGWASGKVEPPNNEISLSEYRTLFKNNQVSDEIIGKLIETVSRWRKKGIEVYAFRPPTIREMVAIENSTSGFDENAFITRFTAAGGNWIDVPLGHYKVSDGSHLTPDSARLFSRDIGRVLAAKGY